MPSNANHDPSADSPSSEEAGNLSLNDLSANYDHDVQMICSRAIFLDTLESDPNIPIAAKQDLRRRIDPSDGSEPEGGPWNCVENIVDVYYDPSEDAVLVVYFEEATTPKELSHASFTLPDGRKGSELEFAIVRNVGSLPET